MKASMVRLASPPFRNSGTIASEFQKRVRNVRLERHAQVKTWCCAPGGEALQALRGGPCPGAVTSVATPRPRRHALGLPPSASSRGARRQQGRMTKPGKPQARRALGAGAWAYRAPANGHKAPAPARGQAPRSAPGQPLAGPRPALQPRSPAAGQRPQGASGRGRPGSGTGRRPGGHGHAGGRATASRTRVLGCPKL